MNALPARSNTEHVRRRGPWGDMARAPISSSMIIVLPELLEDAWARALPGREAAAQNEVLRAFQPCPPSGKPDIEPTLPNNRV
jgi:hypothetical protein